MERDKAQIDGLGISGLVDRPAGLATFYSDLVRFTPTHSDLSREELGRGLVDFTIAYG